MGNFPWLSRSSLLAQSWGTLRYRAWGSNIRLTSLWSSCSRYSYILQSLFFLKKKEKVQFFRILHLEYRTHSAPWVQNPFCTWSTEFISHLFSTCIIPALHQPSTTEYCSFRQNRHSSWKLLRIDHQLHLQYPRYSTYLHHCFWWCLCTSEAGVETSITECTWFSSVDPAQEESILKP